MKYVNEDRLRNIAERFPHDARQRCAMAWLESERCGNGNDWFRYPLKFRQDGLAWGRADEEGLPMRFQVTALLKTEGVSVRQSENWIDFHDPSYGIWSLERRMMVLAAHPI